MQVMLQKHWLGWFIIGLPILAKVEPLPLINAIKVTDHEIRVIPDQQFKQLYLNDDFFVHFEDDLELKSMDYALVTIPFIMSIIHIIWASGKKYTIDAMDYDLYYALKKINIVFKIFFPKFSWSGRLEPKTLIKHHTKINTTKKALLFSGGLDSVTSCLNHHDSTLLLITIRGHDVGLDQDVRWAGVVKHAQAFARTYNHDNAFITSNFHSFINDESLKMYGNKFPHWAYTSQALALSGLAAPLLLRKGYATLMIGSSSTIDDPLPLGSHPMIDNNIAFGSTKVWYDLPDLDRQQKMAFLINTLQKNNYPKPFLRVCFEFDQLGGNCGKCASKCLLTMNNIIAEGQDPNAFGFEVTEQELIERTKGIFNMSKRFLRRDSLDDWHIIQNRIRGIIENNMVFPSLNASLQAYFHWFAEHNFEQWCFQDKEKYERRKKVLMPLWKIAQQGPMDQQVLIHFFASKQEQK